MHDAATPPAIWVRHGTLWRPFDRARVDELLDIAGTGLAQLFEAQGQALAAVRR